MTVYWPNGSLSIPTVTSEYNPARRNPVTGVVQPHRGIDLVGFTDNCSPVDGTVLFAGYNGAAGNEVRIRADGPTAFHVGDCFRMAHNARLYVSTGQRVKARQPVGRMGTTGRSTGVHCHFETHADRLWNYQNPRDFMAAANAGAAFLPAKEKEDDMPINFRNPASGFTYTMVPGVSLQAHVNAFGSRLTNYVNTGVWPKSESDQDRFDAGLRDLNRDHVTWMLGFYGFGRFTADTLPTSGVVYADWIVGLQSKTAPPAPVDADKLASAVAAALSGNTQAVDDGMAQKIAQKTADVIAEWVVAGRQES